MHKWIAIIIWGFLIIGAIYGQVTGHPLSCQPENKSIAPIQPNQDKPLNFSDLTGAPEANTISNSPLLKSTSNPNIKEVWLDGYTSYNSNIAPSGIVQLYDYSSSRDLSYSELLRFLKNDTTDEMAYTPGRFVCSDFAELLQHNAAKAGIRCGFVDLRGIDHACNAFNTTDRGVIFIDDTSSTERHPYNMDKIVDVENGRPYCPRYLFPEPPVTVNRGYNTVTTWWDPPNCMGTINSHYIYWVGKK